MALLYTSALTISSGYCHWCEIPDSGTIPKGNVMTNSLILPLLLGFIFQIGAIAMFAMALEIYSGRI